MKQAKDWKTKAVPITMHGDGVPVVGVGKPGTKSLEIVSWCSLFGTGSTVQFNFYSFSIFKDSCSETFNGNTFARLWKIFSWSLYWLFRGVHPDRDYNGVKYDPTSPEGRIALDPLVSSEYFGVLAGIKGDLDWGHVRLKIANYRAVAAGPCGLCRANGNTMNWRDVRENACWKPSVYGADDWLVANPNRITIFRLPGVTILTFMCDLMHNKHLGVDQYYFGSILHVLCYTLMPEEPSRNIKIIQDRLRAHADRHRTFTNLKLSMFVDADKPWHFQPKLKGQAAEIRHFGPFLCSVFEDYMDANDFSQRMMRLGLKQSIVMEEILDDNPGVLRLPPAAAQNYRKATFQYLACLKRLNAHFQAAVPPCKRFNVTIKSHYMVHSADQALWIHPRAGWCYGGEDFMKKCKKLMSRCVVGNSLERAVDKFVDHYVRGMHDLLQNA